MGIAAATTMLYRYGRAYSVQLASHVTVYDGASRSLLQRMTGAFMAGGADAYTAARRAELAAAGLVARQASMLAFVSVFRLLALFFLLLVPLVLLMRSPKGGSPAKIDLH
jgi:DHA2 family multidrug resistance protein